MAKRIIRRGGQAARAATRALEDALDPIVADHDTAKESFWEARDAHRRAVLAHQDALASGGEQQIEAAEAVVVRTLAAVRETKAVKTAAANRLEDARTWLRREAAIVKLQNSVIPELERKLSRPILTKQGDDAVDDVETRAALEQLLATARADLAAFTAEARPIRAALEQLGGQPAGEPEPAELPPGSAAVDLEPINVRADVHNARKGRK